LADNNRKERHLDICRKRYSEIHGPPNPYHYLRIQHRSMPELDWDQIDTETNFLGYPLKAPFFISAMTGGFLEGNQLNRILAQSAGRLKIPMFSGSSRTLLKHPERRKDFDLKPFLPDSPYLINLGAQELKEKDMRSRFLETAHALKADGLSIHLNPGQELFQSEGERNFRGVKEALFLLIEESPLPVIVKETGCGIHPDEVQALVQAGATWVDLAGMGGSNWIRVEGLREDNPDSLPFADWGHPMLTLLGALSPAGFPLLASGGIRNGMEASKCLYLGAKLTGFGQVLLNHASEGRDGLILWLQNQITILKKVMLLSGASKLEECSLDKLWIHPDYQKEIDSYWRQNR